MSFLVRKNRPKMWTKWPDLNFPGGEKSTESCLTSLAVMAFGTSMSRCIETSLLRLQEIWLAKFITTGLVVPGMSLARQDLPSESGAIVSNILSGPISRDTVIVSLQYSRAAKRGGVQTGAFPDLDLSFLFRPLLSFLGLSRIFSGFSRFVRGLFGDFPDLSFSSFSAY